MAIAKAVTGIVGLVAAAYVITQIRIPVATAAAATGGADASGLAGLLTIAVVLSAAGALVAKIKRLF